MAVELASIFRFLLIRLNADPVIDSVVKTLLTAEVFFRSLDRDVAEQELDLVQVPAGITAQAGTSPAEIMRGQLLDACSLGAVLYDMPHNRASLYYLPKSCRRGKRTETRDLRSIRRISSHESIAFLTQSGTGIVRTCACLADQVNDCPVIIPPPQAYR